MGDISKYDLYVRNIGTYFRIYKILPDQGDDQILPDQGDDQMQIEIHILF